MQNNQNERIYAPPIRRELKIGNTTFIINSHFPTESKESVSSKVERLIKDEVRKELQAN